MHLYLNKNTNRMLSSCTIHIRTSPMTPRLPHDQQRVLPVVPGAVLVLGELHHVAGQVAQLQVGEAVVAEVLQQPAASGGHDV